MKKIAIAILILACLSAPSISAQDITVGDANVSFGDGKALWKEVRLGDTPYSSFVVSEKGKLLDTSGADKSVELLAKIKSLNIHDPCRLSKGKSRHGDEIITLENGIIKLVIIPSLGGRIIELSNKATGANIFMDNYQKAGKKPALGEKEPELPIGGYVDGVSNNDQKTWKTPFRVEVVKDSGDEVVITETADVPVKTWDVEAPVTVQRTIAIEKGSARVRIRVKLVNRSKEQREFRFRDHARNALGGSPKKNEFWLSSLGYASFVPAHEGDAYTTLRVEQKIDTWQGILDRPSREGVAVLVGGEIEGRHCIWGTEGLAYYTHENNSSLREHAVEGIKIEIEHDYAPILNFDALTFANQDLAVEFVPEKFNFTPGETVKAIAGAALIARSSGTVKLFPRLLKDKREIASLEEISLPNVSLLVAEPKSFLLKIPANLPAGRYDLVVDVIGVDGKLAGVGRYRVFVSDPLGCFLAVLNPTDDGYGKGLSSTGEIFRAEVHVEKGGPDSKGAYKIGNALIPWTTNITAAGKALKIVHTADFSKFPEGSLLHSFGLAIPFRLGWDKTRAEVSSHRLRWTHQRDLRVTVGSKDRDEQWLVDQTKATTEQKIPYYSLSDNAARYPRWGIGGVLQMEPTSAWIWKTESEDTGPVLTVQEEKAAGWVNLFSMLTRQGITVYMPDMAKHSPKEILVDGEAGMIYAYFFPPHVRAMSLQKAGLIGKSRAESWGLGPDKKVSFTIFVQFHTTDPAGDLSAKGNVASHLRKTVQAMK
jgi:hypothetical protein